MAVMRFCHHVVCGFYRQIGALSDLFAPDVVAESLIRMMFALLRDRVATVRHATVPSIGADSVSWYVVVNPSTHIVSVSAGILFNQLLAAQHAAHARLLAATADDATPFSPDTTPQILNDVYANRSAAVAQFVTELASLAEGKSYQERQLFVRLADVLWLGDRSAAAATVAATISSTPTAVHSAPRSLSATRLDLIRRGPGHLTDASAFRLHVLPWLVALSQDKVPNVRLAAARTIHAALAVLRTFLTSNLFVRVCRP